MKQKKKQLYIITTQDKYEFPIAIEESPKALAEKVGMNVKTLRSCFCQKYKGYYKVEIDDD